MTDSKTALIELRDKVMAGDVGYWQQAIQPYDPQSGNAFLIDRAYHGSLDAAKALHEAVLPGWEWWRCGDSGDMFVGDGSHLDDFCSHEEDPARAWLLAILEALIAQEDTPQ